MCALTVRSIISGIQVIIRESKKVMDDRVKIPPVDFDWVTARGECSVKSMFVSLLVGVRADVTARNKLAKPKTVRFEGQETMRTFIVARYDDLQDGIATATFGYDGDKLTVLLNGTLKAEATLTLNKKRECRLLVNGEELEQWQFRKMALESIFFGS
jgi:hypothetical protein